MLDCTCGMRNKKQCQEMLFISSMWNRKNGGITHRVRKNSKAIRLCRDCFEFDFVHIELDVKLTHSGNVVEIDRL